MSRGRISPFAMCACALLCTIALKAQTVPDSESFADADEHFKYGSIGTEEACRPAVLDLESAAHRL